MPAQPADDAPDDDFTRYTQAGFDAAYAFQISAQFTVLDDYAMEQRAADAAYRPDPLTDARGNRLDTRFEDPS